MLCLVAFAATAGNLHDWYVGPDKAGGLYVASDLDFVPGAAGFIPELQIYGGWEFLGFPLNADNTSYALGRFQLLNPNLWDFTSDYVFSTELGFWFNDIFGLYFAYRVDIDRHLLQQGRLVFDDWAADVSASWVPVPYAELVFGCELIDPHNALPYMSARFDL